MGFLGILVLGWWVFYGMDKQKTITTKIYTTIQYGIDNYNDPYCTNSMDTGEFEGYQVIIKTCVWELPEYNPSGNKYFKVTFTKPEGNTYWSIKTNTSALYLGDIQ